MEHKLSFLHHVKLEKTSGKCKHECDLCFHEFNSLADFSKHLESDPHKQQLAIYEFQKQARKNMSNRPPSLLSDISSSDGHNYPYPTTFAAPSQFSRPLSMGPQHGGSNCNRWVAPNYGGYYDNSYQQNNTSGGWPSEQNQWYSSATSDSRWSDRQSNSSNRYRGSINSKAEKYTGNDYRNRDSSRYKDWKQYKHPSGVRYNQTKKKCSGNRVIIPNTSSYFEPDVPINVKNMPDLDSRKNMQTNAKMHASKGLEKKLENKLKQQINSEKSEVVKQISTAKKHKEASTSKDLKDDQDLYQSKVGEIKKKKSNRSLRTLEGVIKKKKVKAKNDVKLLSHKSLEDGNSFTEPDSTTPHVGNEIAAPKQPDLAETTAPNQPQPAEKPKLPHVSGNLPQKSMNFADSMKKAFRCPATSSVDVSKRLLADRINRYRLEAASVQSTSSTFSRSISEGDAEKLSVSKNLSTIGSGNLSPKVVPIIDEWSLSLNSKSSEAPSLKISSITKQKLADIVESVAKQTSALENADLGSMQENNKLSAVIDFPAKSLSNISSVACPPKKKSRTEVSSGKSSRDDPSSLQINMIPAASSATVVPAVNVAEKKLFSSRKVEDSPAECFSAIQYVVKCEEDVQIFNQKQQSERKALGEESLAANSPSSVDSNMQLPKPTTTADYNGIASQDNLQMSKMQLLWQVCQKEEKYHSEYLAACNELAELERQVEVCKKRKFEAENRYSENKELRRQLLQSDKTDFGKLTFESFHFSLACVVATVVNVL